MYRNRLRYGSPASYRKLTGKSVRFTGKLPESYREFWPGPGIVVSMSNKLIPLNVAARWLQVPFAWLREEAEANRIPHLRAGKAILCDLDAVEAVLLDRANGASNDCIHSRSWAWWSRS
jgi:hypothetical protein